jgi:ribosomal protein S18 acetylase RimI-like enzyme
VKIQIEKAQYDDAEILVEIYRDAYSENEKLGFPSSASQVKINEVQDWISNMIVITAEEAGTSTIVGTVRLKYYEDWQCYVLSRLAVKSSSKGKGIAAKLMQYAETKLSEMSEKIVRLTVAQNHPYLVDMYKRKGYKIVGERILPDLSYDEFIMEKLI